MNIRQLYLGHSYKKSFQKIYVNPDDFYICIYTKEQENSVLKELEQHPKIKTVFEGPWCVNYRYPNEGPKLKMVVFSINGEANATRL